MRDTALPVLPVLPEAMTFPSQAVRGSTKFSFLHTGKGRNRTYVLVEMAVPVLLAVSA